jgi:hypothetical protein
MNRPIIPNQTHPIDTGRYLIGTNEIVRLYEEVKQWIENRTPGAIIHGRPRLGKTRAINFLIHTLGREFGEDMPIFQISSRLYKNANEATFFEDILKDIGHGLPFSGRASIKRDRLLKFFIEKANMSKHHRIVLFIDDAQRLYEMHYGWLMDINNELDRVGISLTVLLVGQNELVHQRTAFLQAKKAQIVGRFMVHEFGFTGVKSNKELKICLSAYDNKTEFPVGSGYSFSRYYFPDSFDSGLRLENYSSDLFNIFIEMRQEAGLSNKFEIPMQYLTLTIEYVLKKYGVEGHNVDQITNVIWKEAILKSGYVDAELYQEVI